MTDKVFEAFIKLGEVKQRFVVSKQVEEIAIFLKQTTVLFLIFHLLIAALVCRIILSDA